MAAALVVPVGFFPGRGLRRRVALAPEAQGRMDGVMNRHYCPYLDYRTSEQWLGWLKGWRTGQEQFKQRVR